MSFIQCSEQLCITYMNLILCIFPLSISGRRYKIGPVCVFVCVCPSPQFYNQWPLRLSKIIFVFQVTRPTHGKNPRLKKVYGTFFSYRPTIKKFIKLPETQIFFARPNVIGLMSLEVILPRILTRKTQRGVARQRSGIFM